MRHFIEGEAAPGRWELHGWQAAADAGQAAALHRVIQAVAPIAASVTLHDQAAGRSVHG